MKVKRQETLIEVSHLDGSLTAVHPFLRGNYFDLPRQIPSEQRPTMAETASLVYDAYKNPNDDKAISDEIKSIMKNDLFYTFNGLLYTPSGVYIQDNPKLLENAKTNDDLRMSEKDLQSRLSSKEEKGIVFSEDGSVRFLKGYDFKTKSQSSLELSKNPFVIALAGEEGAERLGYIADRNKTPPYLFALKDVKEPVKRVAGLGSCWFIVGLDVIGDDYGNCSGGRSFGVR